MKHLLAISLALIFWVTLMVIILGVPYPNSLTEASFNQLFGFFIPLFFAVVFSLNVFLKNIFISGSISLGFIFILIIQALHSLNLVSGGLIMISIGLLVSYFRKNKKRSPSINSGFKNLTNIPKIHKLTKLRR